MLELYYLLVLYCTIVIPHVIFGAAIGDLTEVERGDVLCKKLTVSKKVLMK